MRILIVEDDAQLGDGLLQGLREAGFEPLMTASIAAKQQWVADQAKAGVFRDVQAKAPWQDYADKLLAARKS